MLVQAACIHSVLPASALDVSSIGPAKPVESKSALACSGRNRQSSPHWSSARPGTFGAT